MYPDRLGCPISNSCLGEPLPAVWLFSRSVHHCTLQAVQAGRSFSYVATNVLFRALPRNLFCIWAPEYLFQQ